MPDEPRPTWITRDAGDHALYNFYFGSPPKEDDYNPFGWWYSAHIQMDPDDFHLLFPDIKLEPGKGPIEVFIHAHRLFHLQAAPGQRPI